MKKLMSIVLMLTLVISLFPRLEVALAQEYEWVLVNVIGYPNNEGWDQANSHESYTNTYSYSHGSYSVTTTYDGRAEEWRSPPKKTGESITLKGSFSDIPQRFKAGEEVSVVINMTAENNKQSFFAFSASANIQFDNVDVKPGSRSAASIRLVDKDGEAAFSLESTNNYAAVNKTVTTNAPKGRQEGDQIALTTTFLRGVTMGTSYIYEWRPAGWDAVEVSAYKSTNEKEPPMGVVPPSSWFTFPEEYPEVGPPADIFVTDLYGDVEIHVFENGLWDTYNPVLGANLPENAVISTYDNSGIELYIEGMGPFTVRPNTDIGIGSKPEAEGKISIFVGHVWGTFKEVMRTGYMDIPMSQAAAGIKGTTFELIDDGEVSTVLVYEGEVEFKSLSLGGSVLVGSGETVKISKTEIGEIEEFNIEAELAKWDQKTQDLTLLAIEEYQASLIEIDESTIEEEAVGENTQDESNDGSGFPIAIIFGAVIVLFAVVAFILLGRRKTKKISNNLSSSNYQDHSYSNEARKYCNNCGNEINENSKFCKECGKSQE